MKEDTVGIKVLQPLRVELVQQEVKWDESWTLLRQSSLGPDMTSFLFKLLHQILPTAERVARILPSQSPHCHLCRSSSSTPFIETLEHALFDCEANQNVGQVLLLGLRCIIPDLSKSSILTLNFNIAQHMQLPVTWNIAQFLSALWNLRKEKKKVELFRIRSEMEANCTLLRKSRLKITNEVLTLIFQSR